MGLAEDILEGLALLQKENFLCDVELEAEGQHVSAHRAVLAAASPYFHGMFSGGFKETKIQKVPIQEVSFAGLKAVVGCIYTTNIELSDDNFSDILPAAHLLQINHIIKECVQWMTGKISETNCFNFLRLAEKYNFEEVQSAIHKFIMHDFVAVRQSAEFKKISQAALCKFLSSDTLRTGLKEIEVFEAAKEWLTHHEITDKTVVFEIMQNVRFALMTPEEVLEMFDESTIVENSQCRKMVKDAANYHSNIFTQPLYDGPLNRPRGIPGVMVIPPGIKIRGEYNVEGNYTDVYFLDFPSFKESEATKLLPEILHKPIVFDSMQAVSIGNFIYLFGTDCFGYQNFTQQYNATTNKWLDLKGCPSLAKVQYAMAIHGEEIFSIGGMFVFPFSKSVYDTENIADEMPCYSISRNDWRYGEKVPVRCMAHAAECIKDLIYLTGGFLSSDETSNKVFAYDVKADIWLTKKSMNHARCEHAMAAVKDNLYVFGGKELVDGNDIVWNDITYIERYDIETDQWTEISNDFKCCLASAFVKNDKILITGGYPSDPDDVPQDRRIVVFDPKKCHIKVHDEELPARCDSHICVYLTLPELLPNKD